jgi:hypothetical protein
MRLGLRQAAAPLMRPGLRRPSGGCQGFGAELDGAWAGQRLSPSGG